MQTYLSVLFVVAQKGGKKKKKKEKSLHDHVIITDSYSC